MGGPSVLRPHHEPTRQLPYAAAFVLIKDIDVRAGQRLEFRIEAQNVLNHPVFGDPNFGFGATSFGQITTTMVEPRQMMLGVKYHF